MLYSYTRVCLCLYTCVFLHESVFLRVSASFCMHMRVYVCIHAYFFLYMCVFVCVRAVHVCVFSQCDSAYTYVFLSSYMCVSAYTYVFLSVHTCISTRICVFLRGRMCFLLYTGVFLHDVCGSVCIRVFFIVHVGLDVGVQRAKGVFSTYSTCGCFFQ